MSITHRDGQITLAKDTQCDVLIDGHVHIHECFRLGALLDAAVTNFVEASREIGLTGGVHHVLLLCDTPTRRSFSDLRPIARSERSSSGWSFFHNGEPTTVAATRDDGARLLLISGRQIETHDGLEVLALCTDKELAGGLAAAETVAAVHDAEAIPVLPWGFGKWRGKRGKLVEQLIRKEGAHRLALGDNSGRLAWLGEPAQFKLARNLGIKVLAGTDPLPFRGQEHRVSSYGSYFHGPFDESRASQSIRSLLSADLGSLVTYGNRELLLPFVVNQTRMQLRKRFTSKRVSA